MHSNVHFALGVLIASLCHVIFPLNIWFFIIVVLSSIVADIDIFFSTYAIDHDHRNFFTHSIYPSIILLCIGIPLAILWEIHVIWVSGIAYGSHILLDCVDWKTRLLFTKKQYGWALLITEDEKHLGKTRKQLQLESHMDSSNFSLYRYFHSMAMVVSGITLAIVSFLVLFTFASNYWYIFIGYFVLLEIYLYQKKKMEELDDDLQEDDGL